MSSSVGAPPPPILLDLDASPISGQIGWSVLDLAGRLLKRNAMLEHDAMILFSMLQEVPRHENFQRLTVTFPGASRFVVTRDETHVYMVQTRAA